MATNNSAELDISGAMFIPISSKRKRPYKSAKVAPAIANDNVYIAPKAIYQQVPMYDRWTNDPLTNDCKSAKTGPNTVEPYAQVPMFERWNW